MRAFNTGPEIEYPTEALFRYGVGAVVMHFGLDANGTVRSRTIAAAVPAGPLAEAVEATLQQWRIEKSSSSAPGCRMPSSFYFSVRFVLR
jgi:outer membrane biosynthesis protein TonB